MKREEFRERLLEFDKAKECKVMMKKV